MASSTSSVAASSGSAASHVQAMDDNASTTASSKMLLPILIIPGLMSTGLEIEESKIKPEWESKRIWLNLSSIGISSMYFGKPQKRTAGDDGQGDEEEYRQFNYKSSWLEHMMLGSDSEADPPGVKVRPILGLEGVDYLTPGAFTNHLSYVFGPVIDCLKKEGYNAEDGKINLMASPYDWRLAPRTMQTRDNYFTRTLDYVEELYNNNDSTPVVLLCHSLGCKVAHYLLNFALDTRGQQWIDKYIHTYMPIGGPHLGAPKAMRGLISGEKMSLDTFLSSEEALAFGRSMGSAPWLIPSFLPEGVPATNYILPHGVLKMSFVHALNADPLVNRRTTISMPRRYQLLVCAKGFDGPSTDKASERTVRTPFHKLSEDHGPNTVVFSDTMSFATLRKPCGNETLQFSLQEPGLASAKKEKEKCKCNPLVWGLCFLCIPCMLIYNLLEFLLCGVLLRGAHITVDAIHGSAGGNSTLAFSEGIKIPPSVWKGKAATIKVTMYHVDDYGMYEGCLSGRKVNRRVDLYVRLQWICSSSTKSFKRICSPICLPSETADQLPIAPRKGRTYDEFSGYDVAEREGLHSVLQFIKQAYDEDPYRPLQRSSVDAPPVRRVHAIYGINLPTEVGCVYSRQDTCESVGKLQSCYVPDRTASLPRSSGYAVSGGIILETPSAKQVESGNVERSGDGTVPYWSLAHAKNWHSKYCRVTVQELEKAPHREILNDARFLEALVDYVKQ